MTESDVFAAFDYEVPKVEDDSVPFGRDLVALRNFAALIEQRTGLKMRVARGEWLRVREEGDEHLYEVMTDHSIGGPAPFEAVWGWLSGYENGVAEALWAIKAEKEKAEQGEKG